MSDGGRGRVDDLQRGLDRLARYADEPILADLVARTAPSGPRRPATPVDLANLRELLDEVFGPTVISGPTALEEIWKRAPTGLDSFVSYLGAVVGGWHDGSSIKRTTGIWQLRRHRGRAARRLPEADEWATRFTRGPAWP